MNTMRLETTARGDEGPDPAHGNHVEFCAWPSIEAFHELAYRRMREGPGCVAVNGLLIRDPLCPTCATARDQKSCRGK